MKSPGKKTLAIILTLLTVLALFFFFFLLQKDGSSHERANMPTPEPAGYYLNDEGVENATGDIVVTGNFVEAVSTEDYVLAADAEGTLTLTKTEDKTSVPISEPKYAYQLKVVGEDFGYLQQHGESQFITFLDPETGESSIMETGDSVATWVTSGLSISYHPYETGTLGFAEYNHALGWQDAHEIDANIATIGGMLSRSGGSYVWAVTDTLENVIYSTQTRENVTEEFPVVEKVKKLNGTLSDVANDLWVVTVSTDHTARKSSQIWNNNGEEVIDLSMLGYNLTGKGVTDSDGEFHLPVSYTNGTTPDGLLVLNPNNSTTEFREEAEAYVGKE